MGIENMGKLAVIDALVRQDPSFDRDVLKGMTIQALLILLKPVELIEPLEGCDNFDTATTSYIADDGLRWPHRRNAPMFRR
jgi:hypothetical protein